MIGLISAIHQYSAGKPIITDKASTRTYPQRGRGIYNPAFLASLCAAWVSSSVNFV